MANNTLKQNTEKIDNINGLSSDIHNLVDVLNHRVTKLEVHIKWLTRLIGYVAIILTGIAVKIIMFS